LFREIGKQMVFRFLSEGDVGPEKQESLIDFIPTLLVFLARRDIADKRIEVPAE